MPAIPILPGYSPRVIARIVINPGVMADNGAVRDTSPASIELAFIEKNWIKMFASAPNMTARQNPGKSAGNASPQQIR